MKQNTLRLAFRFFSILLTVVLLAGLGRGVQAQDEVPPISSTEDPLIVGGQPADPGEWPWQVALVGGSATDLYNGQFCGGSLVAANWVLTAAHCVEGLTPSQVDIVAGIYNLVNPASGYQRRDVTQIVMHPNYDSVTNDYDIALLRFTSPITLGGSGATKTQIVPLVSSSIGPLVGVNSWVTGWGNTESVPQWPAQLYEVNVPIIANSICNNSSHYAGEITNNMLCAGLELGGKDSCQGDSGGPLVVSVNSQWQLAGIVSWGYGCAEPHLPGVYTRVSNFTAWVNSYIQVASSTLTFRSIGADDGYIWETTETSGIGFHLRDAETTFQIGDDNNNRQYRGILSFNTDSLPDNATITNITLKIKKQGLMGTDPFTILGGLKVDIRKPYFGSTVGLVASDFQAAANRNLVGTFGSMPVNNWYTAVLGNIAYPFINLKGTTQIRLRFVVDDNDDMSADYMAFYSGNATKGVRPMLIVEYTVP